MKNDSKTTLQELKDLLKDFRDKGDWEQFHDPKNIAEAITIEASELQELFLWRDKPEIAEKMKDPEFRREVEEELADVLMFTMNFANATGIDLSTITRQKLEKNDQKYPVDKAKGVATKYDKL